MWWHKWFMAVSVSVCSVVHPEIFYFQFPRIPPRDIVCVCDMAAACSNITGRYDVMIRSAISSMPLLNSHICENDGWKRKVGVKKVSLYTGQCGNKDWCVGLLVSSKDPVSHSVQARADRNPFSWKRIQNVLLLRWTDHSGLINKALLLNKTVKDTRLSTCCVPSQF